MPNASFLQFTSQWYVDFFKTITSTNNLKLYELINLSNYLGLPVLTEMSCLYIASTLRGASDAEIRNMHGIYGIYN